MGKLLPRFNFIFYAVVILAVFVPLYPKFPLFEVPKTYVAIRLEDILIAFILGVWFLTSFKKFIPLLKKNITQSILLFWGVGLLSLISAIVITHSVIPHLGVLHYLRRIEDLALFFVAYTACRSIKNVKLFLSAMLFVIIMVILYGFGQVYLDFPVISTENREYSKGLILTLTPGARANSTFAGQYDLAAFLSFALIFLATFFFFKLKPSLKFSRALFEKLILILTGLGGFALLGFTASRISFLASFIGIALSFWLTGKRIFILLLVILCVVVVAVSPQLRHRLVATLTVNILGGGGPKYQPPPTPPGLQNYHLATKSTTFSGTLQSSSSATPGGNLPRDIAPGEPINTTELGVFRSLEIRLNVEWPRAIMAFMKNPLIGTGYSSLTIATDNDYLRAIGETGILGLSSILLIFAILVRGIYRKIKTSQDFEKTYFIAIFCCLVALAITATFVDILEASKIATLLWITMGITWSLIDPINSEHHDKSN